MSIVQDHYNTIGEKLEDNDKKLWDHEIDRRISSLLPILIQELSYTSSFTYFMEHNQFIKYLYPSEEIKDTCLLIGKQSNLRIEVKMFFAINNDISLINFLYAYSYFDMPILHLFKPNKIERGIKLNDSKETHGYSELINVLKNYSKYRLRFIIKANSVIVEFTKMNYQWYLYTKITLKNLSANALGILIRCPMIICTVTRLAHNVIYRYHIIKQINPHLKRDNLIACSVMCSIPYISVKYWSGSRYDFADYANDVKSFINKQNQ